MAAERPRNDVISNGDVVFEYSMSARVEMVLASLGVQGCLSRPLGGAGRRACRGCMGARSALLLAAKALKKLLL